MTNVLKTFLSVLAGLFPIMGASAQSGGAEARAAVIPPVDLDKPVTNPKLVAAICNHTQTHTNETASKLFAELKTAVFLVGTIEDAATRVLEGQVLLKKGHKFRIIEVRDDSHKRLLALFTDHPELQRFSDQANSTLVMPTQQAMTWVLENGYDGLVINPGGLSLRLDAPFLRSVVGKM